MEKNFELKKLKKDFIFHHFNEDGSEVHFCKCGKKITNNNNVANKDEVVINIASDYDELDVLGRLENAVNIICPKCKINLAFEENHKLIVPSNTFFYSYFDLEINDERVTLNKYKVTSKSTDKSRGISFKSFNSYISLDKINNKIFFKGFDYKKEKEFNLDSLVLIINSFYNDSNELKIVDGLVEVHRFLNQIAGCVVDSKNMDIVDGLMSQMIGKSGMDVLMKVNIILFGIILYSNLSTIALTKGTVFLYDMMTNCSLPNISLLSDNGVTSPLKIFNFLVSLENENIQKDIDLESGKNKNFKFKSKNDSRGSNDLYFDLERWGFNRKSVVDFSGGKINVREELKHKTVSKYIFNKIEKFEDYKKIIRFTKFLPYEELVNMVMKYDIDYIINLFDLVEFRSDINSESLKQIIPMTFDYLRAVSHQSSNLYERTSERTNDIGGTIEKFPELEVEKIKNYSLLRNFSFQNYDDSIRIIEDLKWDRNKEFNKIKTVYELNIYHDKLIEHHNMLSDKEKYERFKKYAEKFKYLEDYDGDLKIKILSTPQMVLTAANEMKNCSGSYVTRISQGTYIILMVYDKRKDSLKEKDAKKEFMMGMHVTKNGLEFEQLKASCNALASDEQKTMVMKYLEDKDISYKEVRDLKIGEKSNPHDMGFNYR